jgi:hypothetical protein
MPSQRFDFVDFDDNDLVEITRPGASSSTSTPPDAL